MSLDPCQKVLPVPSSNPGPQHWGHLENLRKVGHGVFGDVFRAWDDLLEREVALKLCRHREDGCEAWQRPGIHEARLLARVRHPNVVTLYGADRHDGRFGLWMEFIRGRTLSGLQRDCGPLEWREAARIGVQLCSAVAATHAAGCLHRDINAKNVMREEAGRIVLLDFGLGQDLSDAGLMGQAQPIRGTPLYMAPEVLQGGEASVQSDVYGIGVLLYYLVTGYYPAVGRSCTEVRWVHERRAAVPLRARRPGLPERFVEAVDRALSPEPAWRFLKADQMVSALTVGIETENRRRSA